MRYSWIPIALLAVALGAVSAPSAAAVCQPTGFGSLTAVLINPAGTVSGVIDAAGCDMGVYYDSAGHGGRVRRAEIRNALYYGVFVNGDGGDVAVDVLDSSIHHVGDTPFNGNQRGVAVYYRGYFAGPGPRGRIAGNTISNYQKGGIVANGPGTKVEVSDNVVAGFGAVPFIAQNGIQIGYGAKASVMKNTVVGHSYTGTSTVSGGIIVVGGPGYGICPTGSPCEFTTGTQIVGNTVLDNDIGIFLTNLEADFGPPTMATNVKAVNNVISNSGLTNNYGGFGYQAGVSDVGNNDKIIANRVSGAGYDPTVNPGAYTVWIDADPSFTTRPKVHANK